MIERNTKFIKFAVVSCFLLYAIVTSVQIYPLWSGLTDTESFAILKHIIIVIGIAAYLVIKPQIGSWAALAWGAIVPFERFHLLFTELLQGTLLDSGVLAPMDTARILMLFIGTCLSALLAYQLHNIKKSEARANIKHNVENPNTSLSD